MGIYLPNMEMPNNCAECPINNEVCKRGYKYLLEHPELYDRRAEDCPLVPVPNHGDLIDREALINDMANMIPWAVESPEEIAMVDGLSAGYEAVKDAPTIIPAEEGE